MIMEISIGWFCGLCTLTIIFALRCRWYIGSFSTKLPSINATYSISETSPKHACLNTSWTDPTLSTGNMLSKGAKMSFQGFFLGQLRTGHGSWWTSLRCPHQYPWRGWRLCSGHGRIEGATPWQLRNEDEDCCDCEVCKEFCFYIKTHDSWP